MLSHDATGIPCDLPGQAPAGRAGARRRRGRWAAVLEAFTTVMTVLIAMVAAIAIVLAIASHMSATGQYTVFGHPVMTVLSGSMSPAIQTGDLIVDAQVTPAQARSLHAGQIVSFRESPGSNVIITHRIIRRISRHGLVSYLTKGDANNAPDFAPRPAKDAVGIVQHSILGGGYVLNALHRPLVLALLFASVLLFFAAGPLFRMARRLDKHSGEETGELPRHAAA